MTATLIDGKALSKKITNEVRLKIDVATSHGPRRPCLAVLLVGDDPASHVYVRHKEKACAEVGIISKTFRLPGSISQDELLKIIEELNNDRKVDGILPQLPLPKNLDRVAVIAAISPAKDVDGLSFYNQGRLNWNLPALRPCTPSGIMDLIHSTNQKIDGKKAVVIGRSILVGLPVQLMLIHAGATVTCVHSKTLNPHKISKEADILIAAAGSKHLVKADWIKPGSIVIDVGIHSDQTTGKLTGDVLPSAGLELAGYLTPVPGGVGPMTIACLMRNCLQAYMDQQH
jgi:methylenetetrahydrofolate dehydrogenase (NADP+)/methenyltetrahydrofolate cyclohydrolase